MKDLSNQRKLAFAKIPSLVRETLRRFRRLTGFTAVSALRPASSPGPSPRLPLPPVHPRCAVLLRKTTRKPPCETEWRKHLQFGQKTLSCNRHICPLGLRCACVPILLGDELVGFAKFVAGPEISVQRFARAVDQLELLIAQPCQALYISLLQEDIQALRISLNRLARAKRPAPVTGAGATPRSPSAEPENLISRVLDYLNDHFADHELSLTGIASAVGKNEKYLAHQFALQVGERMHTYITLLRVRHACELLLATSRRIDAIARASGFAHTLQFRQAFRRAMGVTATEYRQIFAANA